MLTFEVKFNESQIADLEAELLEYPGAARRALSAAVNRTGRWARTQLLRQITKELNIKRKDAAENVGFSTGNINRPIARLYIYGGRIPVFDFGARPRAPRNTRRVRTPVTYQIRKTEPRKALPDAFVAKLKSGHISVFARRGRKRLPIVKLFGPSIPQYVIDSPELETLFRTEAPRRLEENLASQVDRFLKRRKADRGSSADSGDSGDSGGAE